MAAAHTTAARTNAARIEYFLTGAPRILTLTPRNRRSWPRKPRSVDRGIWLQIADFEARPPAQPRHRPPERHFDARDVPVIRVIHLRDEPSDRRCRIPHEPREEAALLVEAQRHHAAAGRVPLHEDDVAVVDDGGKAD